MWDVGCCKGAKQTELQSRSQGWVTGLPLETLELTSKLSYSVTMAGVLPLQLSAHHWLRAASRNRTDHTSFGMQGRKARWEGQGEAASTPARDQREA